MGCLGYQWLCEHLRLPAFPLSKPARSAPVSRLTRTADALLVPAPVAPEADQPLDHVLFALKHEGINLQVLAQALKRIPDGDIRRRVQATPSSRYVRVLGFLWEAFNERETPSPGKAEAFVALLKQAHQPRPMDEEYLVELQNAAITNPLDRAAAYRHEQNWLRGPLRGAAGITYVPPPPEMVRALMDEVLAFADAPAKTIDPLVAAAIASFGFVFVHPFMDGNGRLSRFLFHYALCRSGRLADGLLLPVSVAMKRNEAAYLSALQSFSRPMRRCWDVRWLDDERYDFRFQGDEALYRYWDATPVVEFSLDMARQALENDLREETEFLDRFDRVYRRIDEGFDVRGNALTTLVIAALQNNGKVSKNRRKQFQLIVPNPVFEAIEQECAQVLVAAGEGGLSSGTQRLFRSMTGEDWP